MVDIQNLDPPQEKMDFFTHPIAWGVDEIARVANRTPRQMFHLLATGQIRSARKIGGRWCANREKLLAELSGQ